MLLKNKILIIQTAFLGDVILTLPALETVKKLLPDSTVDFLCIPETAGVLDNNPFINKVLIYDKKTSSKIDKLIDIISRIREENYDIVLCPHRSLRSAILTYYSGAKARIGFDRNSLSFLLTHKVTYNSKEHEIKRNLSLVKSIPGINFNGSVIALKPELFPSENDRKIVNELLGSAAGNLIAFAPCSKWFTKQLAIDISLRIVKGLTDSAFKVILIGAEEDIPYCNLIESENPGVNLLNLCGCLTPLQSSVLISCSGVLVSVDSAAMHLGEAADTPIVVIYGSTVPAFGFYPLNSRHCIIENISLECRPCTDHGRKRCPLGHFKCMKDLDTEKIVKSVKELAAM